jgi:hypothetical protein
MELEFTISNEQNVREAFVLWATNRGYEILESGEQVPDFKVRNPQGDVERFEIERLASDFRSHGHDPDDADRIVCWRNDLGEKTPLPVIQLESDIVADDTLRSTRYVISETGGIDDTWINQFLIWEEGDDVYIKFRYFGKEGEEWSQKSRGTPRLNSTQFSSIFAQIPVDIREEAFLNGSFDTLREYTEHAEHPDAFSDSDEFGADLGTFYRSDGGTISFGVLKSKSAFAVRAFNENNTYRSQGAAQFHEGDFGNFFGGLPPQIGEALFLDLDPETAMERVKEKQPPTADQRKPARMV